MSKYYGEVIGAAATTATRRGFHEIRTCAMSYDGSVIVRLRDKKDWELEKDKTDIPIVEIEIEDEDSCCYGELVFMGTIAELRERLENGK